MSNAEDNTTEVMVLTPQGGMNFMSVETGTTVGSLMDTLTDNGQIADPGQTRVMDSRSVEVNRDTTIDENTKALNFVVNLAGA